MQVLQSLKKKIVRGCAANRCPFYFGKYLNAESWSNSRFHFCWKSLLKARKKKKGRKTYQEIQSSFQQEAEIPTVLGLCQIHIWMTPHEISLCGGCSKRNLSVVNHLHSTDATILTLNNGVSFSRQKEMDYWFHANDSTCLETKMPFVSQSFKLLLYRHRTTA